MKKSNMRMSHIPLRLTTGAFILNAGFGKRNLDEDSAAGLQTAAARVIPAVSRIRPKAFGKVLSYSEMALGAALLTPFLGPPFRKRPGIPTTILPGRRKFLAMSLDDQPGYLFSL